MPDRVLRQLRQRQDVPVSSVIRSIDSYRLAMDKSYVVMHSFVVAY